MIFVLGAGLTYMFGKMVGRHAPGLGDLHRDGDRLFFAGFALAYWAEAGRQPDRARSSASRGGNMEGKESRFGVAASALFATVTTDTSCGAVNSMHDSFMPLGGLDPAG